MRRNDLVFNCLMGASTYSCFQRTSLVHSALVSLIFAERVSLENGYLVLGSLFDTTPLWDIRTHTQKEVQGLNMVPERSSPIPLR